MSGRSQFRFMAFTSQGALENGTLRLEDRAHALRALAAAGLFPIQVEEQRTPRWRRANEASRSDLALGLRMLATLLHSGLPIQRALNVFERIAPDAWHFAFPAIQQAIREGFPLSAAFANSELELPSVALGIIEAGEAGSGLTAAVERAADLLDEGLALRNSIRSALAYPILLAIVGGSATIFLLAVVLPRFAVLLSDMGGVLPASTRLMLAVGNVFRVGVVPGALAICVAFAQWRIWTATPDGREKWHSFLLRLPLVGPVRSASCTARVSITLAALLESGVPLPFALERAAAAAGDAAIQKRVGRAVSRIITGVTPSHALEHEKAITATAVLLIRAGEESGRLSQVLRHAAALEGTRAMDQLRRLIRVAEPALILVFGGLVALVAAALLQAMYSVRPT